MGIEAAIIGSAVLGAGAGIYGANKQSDASKDALASIYRPQQLGQVDAMTADVIRQLSQTAPESFDQQYLPYAGQMLYQAQNVTNPNSLYNSYLNQYLAGAFNPQLDPAYNQMIQGVRGATSARGLTASPYGAGMESLAAQQWGAGERERQSNALAQYMSGQQGMQGLGANALDTALRLQQAQQAWPTQGANLGLQYMGLGANAGAQQAGILQRTGQQQAQPWNDAASSMGDLAGNLLQYKLMGGLTGTK